MRCCVKYCCGDDTCLMLMLWQLLNMSIGRSYNPDGLYAFSAYLSSLNKYLLLNYPCEPESFLNIEVVMVTRPEI